MPKLNVAVLGDSVMWGQGLKHADKFAVIAARQIAARLGKEIEIPIYKARSGAKILASQDERKEFVDTYPAFFEPSEENENKKAFEKGANKLYEELPSTFPTVRSQIEQVDNSLGETIDLVLLDGGANDIDFKRVLDAYKGPPIETFESDFRLFFYEEMKKLIIKARAKFPNALLIVTGYYSAFSFDSSKSTVERFVKYMSEKPEWQLVLNDILGFATRNLVYEIPDWIPILGDTENIGKIVTKVIKRSEFAHSRTLYWLRRAIAELNEQDVRRPGLLFAPSGFRPENALFASGESFIHEDYEAPVHDAVAALRRERCPRFNLSDELLNLNSDVRAYLENLDLALKTGTGIGPIRVTLLKTFRSERAGILQVMENLLDKLDGPTSLREACLNLIEDSKKNDVFEQDQNLFLEIIKSAGNEVARIEKVRIASFIHPNEAGAKQYVKMIGDRFSRHHSLSVKANLSSLAKGSKQINVKKLLKRYGLDPKTGLRACMQHMMVDSIAAKITSTIVTSDGSHIDNISSIIPVVTSGNLVLSTGTGNVWPLKNPFAQFRSGASDFFTIDTFGTLHLSDIRELVLENKIKTPLQVLGNLVEVLWKLTSLQFYLNGQEVFKTELQATIKSGEQLKLPYPN